MQTSPIRTSTFTAGGLALLLLLSVLALIRPRSIDESQYVAAAALSVRHLPYRDFGYLQTPLQPILYSILPRLFPSWQFVATRVANAGCGAGSAMLLVLALRRAGAEAWPAIAAALLFLSCDASLFSFAVARNDALPTLLLTGALAALAGHGSARSAFHAALCLGFAAAAKISFALPAAMLAVLAVIGPAAIRARLPIKWVAAGLLLPIAFVGAFALEAPGAFLFENFVYPVRAPLEWYHLIGRDWKTGWGHPADFVEYCLRGPALAALVTVGIAAWRARKRSAEANPATIMFAALTAAGLVAAYVPNPPRLPYLMPMLPPLFATLGMTFHEYPRLFRRTWPLWAAFAGVGLVPSALAARSAIANRQMPALEVERDAHRLGGELDRAGVYGPIAGLSPEAFADSGRPIDPRFAAGPFLFRMAALTTPAQDSAWRFISLASLSQLGKLPPAAVVIDVSQKRKYDADLNRPLLRAARSAGFVPVVTVGNLQLWLPRPAAQRWTAQR